MCQSLGLSAIGNEPDCPDAGGAQPVGKFHEQTRRSDVIGEEGVTTGGATKYFDRRCTRSFPLKPAAADLE